MKATTIIFRGFLIFLCLIFVQSAEAQMFKTLKAIRSLRVAQGHVDAGKLDEARIELERTINIKNDFAVAYRELGRVNLELFKFDEAIDAYEKSFALDSKLSRAAYFECDHHSTPSEFMTELKAHLLRNNVKICTNETVIDVEVNQGIIKSVKSNKQTHIVDDVVMATGSWTGV